MGTLPPFEVAKAFAFHVALAHIERHTGMSSRQLLGESRKAFIARQLQLEGGGTPGFTAVQNAVKKCSEQGWHPARCLVNELGGHLRSQNARERPWHAQPWMRSESW